MAAAGAGPQNNLTQKKNIRQEPQEGPTGNRELDAELDNLEAHTKVHQWQPVLLAAPFCSWPQSFSYVYGQL